MAIRLDEVIRKGRCVRAGGPHRHWHILAALSATISCCSTRTWRALKGRARQWFGWVLIIASDVSLGRRVAL